MDNHGPVMTDNLGSVAAAAGWGDLADLAVAGNDPVLPSAWPCGELAAVALGRVGVEVASLGRLAGHDVGEVNTSVNNGAAAVVGYGVQRLDGELVQRTNVNNPFVGRYRAGDGRWIFLHGGMPGLKRRLCDVLNLPDSAEKADLERVVHRWHAGDLENLVAAEGGCSGVIRTEQEWRDHPHGRVVHSLETSIESVEGSMGFRDW
jgi:crotonobetainyl-CoA:carnitine CoA-transferase CaiB-like acyl-CoA transferase